ncbi:THUMP domain-containing protein 3-like [Elysia marginata]|uniref:THUMP domain-containing protein 3-like n=1 Tax=Elysia marginata TaxID=1093978 RepID=A0AAV4EYI5_9GAST|nr:THUMP domain-containing protein 3-like [Elysia marginata]
MARTARPGARACLLTEDKTSLIKAIQTYGKLWQRRFILSINIGGLSGFVFVLIRTTAAAQKASAATVSVDNPPENTLPQNSGSPDKQVGPTAEES